MADDIKTNDSAAHAPEEVRRWAQKIAEAQGCKAVLSSEASGYHLYIPCPDCLHTHGRKELDDPKYAINLSILAGLGEFRAKHTGPAWMPGAFEEQQDLMKRRDFGSGICMRTRSSRDPHRFSVERLLNMATVTDRHPDILTRAEIHGGSGSAENEDMYEPDPVSGIMCPPPAGEVIPLSQLPEQHPAVQYLLRRGYNVVDLEKQFRCGYCVKEYPAGEKGIFYRRMPGGWRDSPQHRVIFHALIDKAPLTWQARVIEKVSADERDRYMLHPYAGGFFRGSNRDEIAQEHRAAYKTGSDRDETEWVRDEARGGYWVCVWNMTHTRANPQTAWQPVEPFDEIKDGALRFRPSKYRTAKYSSRQMMGWDAAIQRADDDHDDMKWVVLCEGPLDAARIGPGGVAVIGSSISPENASKIAGRFHLVFTAFDDDIAGRDATDKVMKMLNSTKQKAPLMIHAIQLTIPAGKDPGDLTNREYTDLFQNALRRTKRHL